MWQLQSNRVQKLFNSIWSLNLNSLKNYCLIFTINARNSFRKKIYPGECKSAKYRLFCPPKNWSWISKLLYRNDHHVESMCRAQHLGRMTLQQNRVRPITLLFEIGFRKYFTEMITILRQRVARNNWVATLKVNVTTWPCSKIVSGP